MPDRAKLAYILSRESADVKAVRIPGANKPLEQMTISELVQLRPGGENKDTYEVNAVTDNVSVTTSSLLHELGRVSANQAVARELAVTQIRTPGAVAVIRNVRDLPR